MHCQNAEFKLILGVRPCGPQLSDIHVGGFARREHNMTSFVEILPEEYDPHAFEDFNAATSDFKIGNARALMWFSQLAYETHRRETIDAVARGKWDFTSVTPFIQQKTSVTGSFETCGLIGERDKAVILAFAGTDPGIWQNLVSDFTPVPRAGSDTHDGFRVAAAAAQPQIDQAVQLCLQSGKPLFVTGHSLGAALAALAALSASNAGTPLQAVYTFGMPRVGGSLFAASYADLSKVTYRLVHGLDLVARVPPRKLLTGFHHVGRLLQCGSGKKFAGAPPLSQIGLDEPTLSGELTNTLAAGIGGLLSGHVLGPTGPGTFGAVFPFLPQPIRDHLQDSYWKALTP
jgi:triacylglycerol lipase